MAENNANDSVMIGINDIAPAKDNPNEMNKTTFTSLIDNIDKNGFIGDILVRPHPDVKDKFEIIDGEHRWKACKELRYKKISCIVVDYDDYESALQLFRINNDKGNFDDSKLLKFFEQLDLRKMDINLIKKDLCLGKTDFYNILRQMKANQEHTIVLNFENRELCEKAMQKLGFKYNENSGIEQKLNLNV